MKDLFGKDEKRPTVCCDNAVFTVKDNKVQILLVKRKRDPFKNSWCLPGGFMNWGEFCEQAAARELEEETNITDIGMQQIGAFSGPGRDPRGTVVSVAYFGFINENKAKIKAGDDAAEAAWHPIDELPKLAFDHSLMVETALHLIRGNLDNAQWLKFIMPKGFPVQKLKKLL